MTVGKVEKCPNPVARGGLYPIPVSFRKTSACQNLAAKIRRSPKTHRWKNPRRADDQARILFAQDLPEKPEVSILSAKASQLELVGKSVAIKTWQKKRKRARGFATFGQGGFFRSPSLDAALSAALVEPWVPDRTPGVKIWP